MADRFEDDRGVIQDLLGPVDSVTRIFTRKGKIRGNHVHEKTTQWTYVVWGSMLMVTRSGDGAEFSQTYGQGALVRDDPGVAHAWQALEDTMVLVFSSGPRSGEDYESDVARLPEGKRLLC